MQQMMLPYLTLEIQDNLISDAEAMGAVSQHRSLATETLERPFP